MSVSDIVDLTIIVESSQLSRPNFGTPLALVSKVPAGWGVNMVRTFSKPSELIDLGFTTSDPAYKIASLIKAQKPCPKKFKIAKRATAPTQTLEVKCISAAEGDVYSVEVGVGGGATTAVTYTVPAASTTTTVATAIELLIEAVSGVNSSAATNTITVTPAVVGTLVNLKSWSSNFQVTDVTADPGIATDCAAALAADTDWYGLLLDSNSEAEVKAAAAWANANDKLFGFNTSDWGVQDSGTTTDVASDVKLLGYDHVWYLFDADELLGYSAAAWMARGLAFDPGSATWAFKDLQGVTVDTLTEGQQDALEAKNCNYYTSRYGKSITHQGKVAKGEFIDVTHFLDWLDAEMRIQVFNTITKAPKLPYTNTGLGALEATIKAVLEAGVRAGGLVPDSYTVTMPKLEDIDAVTRANRLVPDIEFDGVLAGAIHSAKLEGRIRNG